MSSNFKYSDFEVSIKGISFKVKLIDPDCNFPEDDSKSLHEQFKVTVINKDKLLLL